MRRSNLAERFKKGIKASVKFLRKLRDGISDWALSFERRLRRVGERTNRIGDSVSQADSTLKRFFIALGAPFSRVWFKVLAPFGTRLVKNPAFKKFGHSTYWLWYPWVALAFFLKVFLQTRRRVLLIWLLPMFIVFGGTAAAWWMFGPKTNSVSKKYREAIQEALAKGEYQQAQLYQHKLQSLGIRQGHNEIRQIEELARDGKLREAVDMAERLAPLDKAGFPEAHFWLARQYYEEATALKGTASLERAELHLKRLEEALKELNVKAVPHNVVLLSALLMFKKNELDQGLALIKSVSSQFWPALVLQLEMHVKLGQSKNAIEDALAVSQLVKKQPEILEELSLDFFPMWCTALAVANEREELRIAISHWFQKHPGDRRARVEWTNLQFMEIDTLMVRGSESDLTRATQILIQTTARLDYEFQPFVSSLLLKHLPPTGNHPNYLRLVELAAQDERASSLLLEILGTAATLRDDVQNARQLLTRATQKDPNNPIALNNLAFVIDCYFDDDRSLALELADRAVNLQPDNMDFLHTRGFIHLHLRRWESAIEDLRIVAARKPNESDIHLGLAQSYREIGKLELAVLHENQAK
jgi:tetratricopeptide (TPR) repeat protein